VAGLAERQTQLQVDGTRSRLLAGQALEHLHGGLAPSSQPLRSAQHQARMGMTWNYLQNLDRLFRGKGGVLPQQLRRMVECDIERSRRLCSTTHRNIPGTPNE
jgi:hypothetical protein